MNQRRSQKFVSDGDKTGGLGTEVPQRGPGAEPWWGSGAMPPEAEDIYANNNCNNALTKNPPNFFQHGNFREGGHVPLVPPSLRPCHEPPFVFVVGQSLSFVYGYVRLLTVFHNIVNPLLPPRRL